MNYKQANECITTYIVNIELSNTLFPVRFLFGHKKFHFDLDKRWYVLATSWCSQSCTL